MSLTKIDKIFTDKPSRYKKGQIIMHAGDAFTHIYLLKSGFIKMYSITNDGEEKILLIFPKNQPFPIFPNMAADSDYKLRYFYEAMSDISICKMSLADFTKLMEQDKQVASMVLD